MLTPSWPIGIRPFSAQLLRGIEPVTAVVAANDHPERDFVASLAGRSVSALVLGRADDGHGIVDIDGHHIIVAADLPPPGASVTLRFATGTALPAQGTVATTRANPAAPALQAGAAAPSAGGPAGVLVELRSDAISVGKMAQAPLQPLQLGPVAANIDQPGDWAAALAGMLRDSGTFYESHLAAWTRGSYPLENIRREPQAGGALPTAPSNGAGPAPAGASPGSAVLHMPAGSAALADETHVAAAVAGPGAAAGALPEEWRPVIREQLHTLETQTVPFSVDAWPGQRADLVIARKEPEAGSRDGQPAAGWKTTLKLQLPLLGNIAATLSLSGDRLWLDLAAPAASAERLDDATNALATALRAAGIDLVRTRIQDHAP